jgi:DNA-binding response OmpR family regulator
VEEAQRAGADGYIHKPFRGVELMELVSKLREQRRG